MQCSYHLVQHLAENIGAIGDRTRAHHSDYYGSRYDVHERLLESINLRVELPMILEVDNKGAVDLINNYSVGGRTRHMETRQYYLRELKEQGVMSV